jgi:hypothetical protein
MVLEAPPMVFGGINDIWFRWVIDLGITCPDTARVAGISCCPSATR